MDFVGDVDSSVIHPASPEPGWRGGLGAPNGLRMQFLVDGNDMRNGWILDECWMLGEILAAVSSLGVEKKSREKGNLLLDESGNFINFTFYLFWGSFFL
jgi:hypothetical protein